MAIELYDTDVLDRTVTAGETVTLEAHSAPAQTAQVLIDGGTNGADAPTYDLEKEYYIPELDDYMTVQQFSDKTAGEQKLDALGADTRISVTNTTNSDQNMRIVLQIFKEI